MSCSPQQLIANQRNALLSTGPKSDAGKARSRFNAIKHCFTGQTIVKPGEDMAAYLAMCEQIVADWKPETETEVQVCQGVCDGTWRLNRIHADECAIHALGFQEFERNQGLTGDDQADHAMARAYTIRNWAKELEQLSRFEQRLARKREKDIRLLRDLITGRRKQIMQDMNEFATLALHSQNNDLPFDAEKFGFVSRTQDLDRQMAKEIEYCYAKQAQKESANRPDQAA